MRFIPAETIINETGISAATDSGAQAIDQVYGFAVQVNASNLAGGATAVTFSIQGSVDGATFVEVATTSIGAATDLENLDAQHYLFMKVIATPDAGTADVVVKFSGKAY